MNILSHIAFLSAALGMVSCGPLLTSEFIEGEGLMYEGFEGSASEYAPAASYSAASYGTNYGTGYGTEYGTGYGADYNTASNISVHTPYYANSTPGRWMPPPPEPNLRHPHPRYAHPRHVHPRHARPHHDIPPHRAHHPSPRGIHPPKDLKDPKRDGFRMPDRHFRKGDPKPPQGKAKPGNPPHAPKDPGRGEKPEKEYQNH